MGALPEAGSDAGISINLRILAQSFRQRVPSEVKRESQCAKTHVIQPI